MRRRRDSCIALIVLSSLATLTTVAGGCRQDPVAAAAPTAPATAFDPPATRPVAGPEELAAQLIAAISSPQNDKEKALRLIREGADVGYYHSRWHSTAYTPLFVTTYNPDMAEVTIALLARGADVRQKVYGLTPLHNACLWNNAPVAEVLIAAGADLDGRESGGFTPLHAAAALYTEFTDTSETCEVLLKHGADVNAIDGDGKTPLDHAHTARWNGAEESRVLDVLIAHGGKSAAELTRPAE